MRSVDSVRSKKIKKGDLVKIIAGKDRGKQGKILSVTSDGRVVVEGYALVTKHSKGNPQAGLEPARKLVEASIDQSNVLLVNPTTMKADRVGFKFIEMADGSQRKVRFFKSNGEVLED